jgi:hypothetical protein
MDELNNKIATENRIYENEKENNYNKRYRRNTINF